ncbi:MAG: hypothetical protein IJ622_12435 [Bacteroidales bacterium]|nr:hypothetical protein [Bacteroidales bacterium]
MKKLLYIFFGLAMAFCLSACGGSGGDVDDFDVTNLYGKWQEGTVFERYYAQPFDHILPNGDTVQVNGFTWDESDDISEEEAQPFNWTLTGSTLVQEHITTFNQVIPKVYTISSLTSDELVYGDNYSREHHYSRVF